MKAAPHIPETAPFSLEQRAWLNGFLAGLFSNEPSPLASASPAANGHSPSAKNAVPLLVMFGSQTGTAEELAKRIAKESKQRGFEPRVLSLNEHEQVNLATAEKVVLVSSTWGEGDPPDNAVLFWNWLKSDSAPRLESLRFAVLGLGDRNYSDFCGASKKFDTRLEELGAKRLLPRGECDVDYEPTANAWISSLWESLGNGNGTDSTVVTSATSTPSLATAPTSGNGHAPSVNHSFGKSYPFPARVLRNERLSGAASNKEVRHYELSLKGSGLSYEVGDALGVYPVNSPQVVDAILDACGASRDEKVRVGERELSLREALLRHLDISRPTQELLALMADASADPELLGLLSSDRSEDCKRWLWGRDVLDLMQLRKKPLMTAKWVAALKKLTPRLYSISSSPKAHPDEVHLTIGTVRYESHGRARTGVASGFLADRVQDLEFVKVFVQPSHGFKPPSGGDVPMIMVGPGTGIAPFRAFLEEREATGAKGKNWLFFGDQTRASDFLYEDQITRWRQSGLLTRLDLAFSRDQAEKIYVQQRMLEQGGELWKWLEQGAHFYVCGDASRMAKDVDAALHQVIEQQAGKSVEEAKTYIARMKTDKRYQRDVY